MDQIFDLIEKIRNITTPYEYRIFPKVFEVQLKQLPPQEYENVMSEYEKKKGVLSQENMRADQVYQLGLYHLYQAFTGDKRIVQLADTMFSNLNYYQRKADEESTSLYTELMKNVYNYGYFIRLFGAPIGARPKKPVVQVEKSKETPVQEEKKEELPVVAFPPEIFERISNIEDKTETIQEALQKLMDELKNIKTTSQAQPSQPPAPAQPMPAAPKRIPHKKREFPVETTTLYDMYIGKKRTPINLAVFQKFLDSLKKYYPTKTIEMNDLTGLMDEVDWKGIKDAIEKNKGISEAFSSALNDLFRKVLPEVKPESMEEKELEKMKAVSEIDEKARVLSGMLSQILDQYRIAKENNDEEELDEIRTVLARQWNIGTDEEIEEAMEDPYAYIIKNKDYYLGGV